jgi:hypothetical protein
MNAAEQEKVGSIIDVSSIMKLYLLEVWFEYEGSDRYFITSNPKVVEWWQKNVERGTYSTFELDSINFNHLPSVGIPAIKELIDLGVEIKEIPKNFKKGLNK